MKLRAFTLVECLISLAIACFLVILTPPLISRSYVNWKEEVFLREFEQVMDTAQITAISTGKGSFVTVLGGLVELNCHGARELDKKIRFPETMRSYSIQTYSFKPYSGNVNQFSSVTFDGQNRRYTYVFQLGEAKYHVEITDK